MYSDYSQSKKFEWNGLPNNDKKENELKIKEKLEGFDENWSHDDPFVIQFNSTFIEVTDTRYLSRGLGTLGYLLTILVILILCLLINSGETDALTHFHHFIDFVGWSGLLLPILVQLLFMVSIYELLKESFNYTHLPIRLNRKNRKIYIWKRDGTVLTTEWDKAFFCISEYRWDTNVAFHISCFLMEGKGKHRTATGIFRLGYASKDINEVRNCWEYLRRYMEDGPKQPHRMLKECLPIAKRYETWQEGYARLPKDWFTVPICFLASFARVFAMRTSKIPRWPDWVERECMITKHDPYVRESGYEEV
ncbi:DUF6708 domain-containing protein [Pseudoduganella sp. R-43]|uniref:DUF6708 domain-containing protein n=1 Tax=unclassified Pseudoduganella TaxID=2637179 RepID=UPI003CEBFD65